MARPAPISGFPELLPAERIVAKVGELAGADVTEDNLCHVIAGGDVPASQSTTTGGAA